MMDFAGPLGRVIDELRRLPGVGQKSAQRIAFSLLRMPREDAERLARAILDVKDKLTICIICNNISDGESCSICRNPNRDQSIICVVEEPPNIVPIETTRTFNGLYHILHGAISPLRGVGPEQLRIKSLVERLSSDSVKEIILATNPTVEGEATASYLSRLIKPLGIRVTRIAMGIPVGSDLEFADEVTMSKSMENRREL